MNRGKTKQYRKVNLGEVAMPICVTHSSGNELIDVEGNRYLDFCSGSGVTNAGWHRTEVHLAVKRQLDKLSYCAPWYPTEEAIGLSELLLSITPDHLTRCGRATGGADANELIYRAAHTVTGKSETLTLSRAYHGGSRLTVNMSDAQAFRLPELPIRGECHQVAVPYAYRCSTNGRSGGLTESSLHDIEKALDTNPNIGLCLCEPILGSGGVIIPPDGYLQGLRDLCRSRNVVFALDEVITAFGRAGHMTLSEYWDLEPDAISFGKGMGGGTIPIGSAVMTEELAAGVDAWEDVSPTFAWTPLACAAAAANIQLILDEELCHRSRHLGEALLASTRRLFARYLPDQTGEVRGMGMMIGVELVTDLASKDPAYSLTRRLIIGLVRAGLMIKVSWDLRVLIFMPPLNISELDIERALTIIEEQLAKLALATV